MSLFYTSLISNWLGNFWMLSISNNLVNCSHLSNFEIFRKTFGSTWIRKVKKAGTELMNKVN